MNPSLLLIPDRYKASKLYSQIPDSGAGDLAFTRANDTATRVNSAGLIEKVRTNVMLNSEQFDNATWTKINVNVTANSTTAPNGTLTADTILAPLSSANAVFRAISSEGAMTLSVYAKANTSNFVYVEIFDASPPVDYVAIFDLSNGTFVGNGGLGSVDSFSIENVGNGWYRLSVTKNVGAVGSHNYIVGVAQAGNSVIPVAGTSVFVWGAQVEASDFGSTPYIPTTTAAVSVGMLADIPRIDYTGGGCGKLLLEPQRSNVALFSEQFNNAYYTKSNATITANNAVSPDGFTSADLLTFTTSAGFMTSTAFLGTPTTAVSVSLFVKAGTSNLFGFGISDGILEGFYYTFNLATQTATLTSAPSFFTSPSFKIENYGNGWYRLIVSAVSTSNGRIELYAQCPAGLTPNYLIYGAQIEQAAYATSYIPTLGASVTRSADAASKTGISSLIGQSEGVLYWEGEIILGESSRFIFVSDGTTTNFINTLIAANGQVSAAIRAAAVTSTSFTSSALSAGVHKIAFAYKANDSALYIDGVSISGTSGAVVPATSRLDVGSRFGTDSFLNSGTSTAALYPTRLSNAQLSQLTTL